MPASSALAGPMGLRFKDARLEQAFQLETAAMFRRDYDWLAWLGHLVLNLVGGLGMLRRDWVGCAPLLVGVFATKALQGATLAALPIATYVAHRAPLVACFRCLYVSATIAALPSCCTDYERLTVPGAPGVGAQHILLWQSGIFGSLWYLLALPLPLGWQVACQLATLVAHALLGTRQLCNHAMAEPSAVRLVSDAHALLQQLSNEVLLVHGYPPDPQQAVELAPTTRCVSMVLALQVVLMLFLPLLAAHWLEAWQRCVFLRRHKLDSQGHALAEADPPVSLVGAHTPLLIWLQLHVLLLLACLAWETSATVAAAWAPPLPL